MVDFGTPDIISSLIYAGPGSSSLTQAASAWTNVAEQLETQLLDTRAVLSGLDAAWQGPSARAMHSAVQQFLMWTQSTATAARQTAQAAQGAASAYQEVRAAVVPPPVIAANRTQLMSLISTNLLGQNTAAIAATEAQYEAFWAQDTAAMNTYQAGSSASTAALPTFQAAPAVTTPGSVAPAASAPSASIFAPGSFLYDSFQALLSSGAPIDIVALFSAFFGPFLGSTVIAGQIGAQNAIIAGKPNSVFVPPQISSSPSLPKVSASSGNANRIGPMRVPPSWVQPPQQPVATPLTPSEGKDKKNTPIGIPFIPAVPVAGSKSGWKKGVKFEDLDYGEPVPPIVGRHPSGG